MAPRGGVRRPASRLWAERLAGWRIPDELLARAPAPPWSFPAGLARADPDPVDTPSRDRALEVLRDGGTVLDVGCGSGRAGLALIPPATHLVGVDVDLAQLRMFARAALDRGASFEAVPGSWPDIVDRVEPADVVLAHHVAYSVPDLGSFATALGARARGRVVLDLAERHPMDWLGPLWRRFWGLERPDGPTATDAVAVLAEAGMEVNAQAWQDASRRGPQVLTEQERVEFVRTRLCLQANRDAEIAEALADIDFDAPHRVVTLWWDTAVSD